MPRVLVWDLVWDGEGAIGRWRGGKTELTAECQAFRGTLAGRRTIVFLELIAPELASDLASYAQPGSHGLVFVGPAGAPLRRTNFRPRVWLPALRTAGLPAIHFHDLRHTGNGLTANAGANLRELMTRMGHTSTRAALIYLHSTDERQREKAEGLGQLVRARMTADSSVLLTKHLICACSGSVSFGVAGCR